MLCHGDIIGDIIPAIMSSQFIVWNICFKILWDLWFKHLKGKNVSLNKYKPKSKQTLMGLLIIV